MALEETKKVLPSLKKKLVDTIISLEALIVSLLPPVWMEYADLVQIEEGKKGSESNVEHITAAKEAIAKAKTAEREVS